MKRKSIIVACSLVWVLSIYSTTQSEQAVAIEGVVEASINTTTVTNSTDTDHRPHAGMLRYPDVSADQIVFVYANDLWLVPRSGGLASPLASPPGPEQYPRFSPDGRTIAFVGNYEGNRDLYTIPSAGGIPTRVSHHPARESLDDWTGDGRILFYSNGLAGLRRQTQLFTVSVTGGMPQRLPVPYGANGAISPDGRRLAYTPHSRDHRTWKRYEGGMATDIWLFDLIDHSSKKITEWRGTDTLPMWHGKTIYYLSDQGTGHKLNIWAYNTANGRRRQVTHANEYDVKWPSIGPGPHGKGEIVFQYGPELQLLDLSTEKTSVVDVVIPGDRPTIRPREVDDGQFITDWNISSTGKRAVLEARGDIWTVPAKEGSPRNLTRTDGVAERDPAWSPDKKWIAYFSDATGEYELYIMPSDGKGETRQLTHDGSCYRYRPTWSPDSKLIAFTDKTGAIFLHTIETGVTKHIDTEPWASPPRLNWSSDSQWITYTKGGENRVSSIWLYDAKAGRKYQVTSGMFNDSWPTFDRKGDYLFYSSNREFTSPLYEDVGTTFVYANTDRLLVVPLRKDMKSPLAPKSDEETWDDESKNKDQSANNDDEKSADKDKSKDDSDKAESAKDGDGDKDKDNNDEDEENEDGKEKEPKPLVIDLEGFERRAVLLPVKRGAFTHLAVNDKGQLIYTRGSPRGSDAKSSIKLFDLKDEKKEEKTVLKDVAAFRMTADGKKLLVRKDKKMAVIDAKADQKMDKPISLAGMTTRINPRTEWRQIFHESWRIHRDFFYDPHMHEVDWKGMEDRYVKMLQDCVSREDVTFVIGEMISELNVGHAYVRGAGDVQKQPSVSVGMLGCDYALHDGAYQIAKIYEGAAWDADARGPLSQPGIEVKQGDYLLAVNGVPIDINQDIWAAFLGMADRVVTLTVSEKPSIDEDARDIIVKLLKSESNLRYRAWIETNRSYVEQKTDGQVGYIHVPDTSINGQNNLFRQFYGQVDKAALIIDERWNGGGQIPTRFIELLNRPITNYWARRDGRDWPWPPDSNPGPKCMLINGLAGSGGDAFPSYFRQAGLGKLIGMRTWGGLIGISGNPVLIDGGYTSSPTFAYYTTDGRWDIEGHGVDPDIEVVDDPAMMADGGDPQLDAAIHLMLKEIEDHGYTPPKRPSYVDRSGMGPNSAAGEKSPSQDGSTD